MIFNISIRVFNLAFSALTYYTAVWKIKIFFLNFYLFVNCYKLESLCLSQISCINLHQSEFFPKWACSVLFLFAGATFHLHHTPLSLVLLCLLSLCTLYIYISYSQSREMQTKTKLGLLLKNYSSMGKFTATQFD